MICSHCGAKNRDDAVICVQCGEALKPAADKNVKKKSNAASRIRKISVESVNSRSDIGRSRASEHTLENVADGLPALNRNDKTATVEDTLDLSNFHLENIQLQEINLDDSDGYDGADGGTPSSEGRPPKKHKKWPWILLGIILVAVIAAAAVLIVWRKNAPKDYADIILEGNRCYQEANYGQAEDVYQEALRVNPDGAEAYFGLADVYLAMNDLPRALDILTQGYEKTKNDLLKERLMELSGSSESETLPEADGQSDGLPAETAPQEGADGNTPQAASQMGDDMISWLVVPDIVTDNIIPVPGCTPEEDIFTGDMSVIIRDGLFGLINSSGQVILEPQYSYILKCAGLFYVGMDDGSAQRLNGDYTVNSDLVHSHEATSYDYLWDDTQKAVFRIVHSGSTTTVEESPFQMGENMLVPVIAGTREDYPTEGALYGLASSQGLCTDFVYENTGKCSWDGMMAVCRNGKWGYCNLKGEEVVPCLYEGADYVNLSAIQESVSYTPGAPYGYSGGFTAVKRDGYWGYLDKNSNVAVPFVFDEARPARGEKAWVKFQGKWGVISLSGAAQPES